MKLTPQLGSLSLTVLLAMMVSFATLPRGVEPYRLWARMLAKPLTEPLPAL